MKELFGISLCLVLLSYWWQSRDNSHRAAEVITTPEIYSLNGSITIIDQLQKGYDPRRYGIEVLEYLNTEGCGNEVPFSWDDVVDKQNKTDLGIHYMEQFSVDQIILMKEQLHKYPTKFGDQIPYILKSSISKRINDFFLNEPVSNQSYKSYSLSQSDFQFQSSPPHYDTTPRYRYFKEGSLLEIPGLSHYDLRFYHSKIEPIDRIAILHRIAKSWFRFSNKLNLKTWIAHGSLLGYYFNGLIMPWDDDLDVQITAQSFEELKNYNGSLIIDYNDLNLGKYLIDINPWYAVRSKESDNKIDARFIDVESGLYIDITTLSNGFIDKREFDDDGLLELYKVFNPYFDQILTEVEYFSSAIEENFNKSIDRGELIFCKDYHIYKIEELNPLVPSVFEGGISYVPNNIQNLLLREYKRKSLYLYEYQGFKFDKFQRIWKHESIKYEYNEEISKFIKHHESIRQSIIKRNEFNSKDLIEFPTFRVEPWIRNIFPENHLQ